MHGATPQVSREGGILDVEVREHDTGLTCLVPGAPFKSLAIEPRSAHVTASRKASTWPLTMR
jgi:hypothetical protein